MYADEDDVSVVPLDEILEDYTENEISDFVSCDTSYTIFFSYFHAFGLLSFT